MASENNEKFVFNFIQFLTYRSQGNPKQLKRLFYEFIRPATVKINKKITSYDILEFGDNEIIRIQFLADVFYNLNLKVGNYIAQADDKMATAIFYLSDFIMKFHDHAFSWRHLYRLDELAHIHRLPELQRVFESIVQQFSGLYLHKVLNGIFVFKFRSDLSKELAYLSKVSDTDSAAYNFTLDESGDLKKIYKRKLKENDSNNLDLITGLGELYDLDKEFDAARSEYVNAIERLDKNYNMRHSYQGNFPIGEILSDGSDSLKTNITWGNERLTLMLMLGQTYERDNRPFVALSHYRDARSLARKLIITFLGNGSKTKFPNEDTKNKYISMNMNEYIRELSNKDRNYNTNKQRTYDKEPVDDESETTRHNVLKYFNILYQPLFAEAWLIEKLPGGLDTSLVILEKGIGKFRTILPFMKNMQDFRTKSPSSYSHSNFSLIASQLHNKVGDLAFFKGNQVERKELKDKVTVKYGYLLRATYHYAVALHELRRFFSHRLESSNQKFNPTNNKDKDIDLFSKTNKPDYLALALSSNLMDIGESTLAKMDIFSGDFLKHKVIDCKGENALETPFDFFKIFDKWIRTSSKKCNKDKLKIILKINDKVCVDCGLLSDWLGKWNLKKYSKKKSTYKPKKENFNKTNNRVNYPDVLEKMTYNHDPQRLFIGIHLSWTGIKYLEQGGYYESASKEYLELANLISTSVWWFTIFNKDLKAKYINKLSKMKKSIENLCKEYKYEDHQIKYKEYKEYQRKHNENQYMFTVYIDYLLNFSISCLKSAENVVFINKHGRLAPNEIVPHVNEELEKVLYPEFVTSAYSLYLLCLENKVYHQCPQISDLLHKWSIGHKVDFFLFELYKKVKKLYVKNILNEFSQLGCRSIRLCQEKIFDQSCFEKVFLKKTKVFFAKLFHELLYKKVDEIFKDELFKNIKNKKKEVALLLKNELEKFIDKNLESKIKNKFKMAKPVELPDDILSDLYDKKINGENGEIKAIINKWVNRPMEFKLAYETKLKEFLKIHY